MKKIAAICLVFFTVLTHAQENQKEVKGNNSTKQVEQAVSAYFRNYTGTVTISKKEVMEMDTIMVHGKDAKADLNKFVVTSYELTVAIAPNNKKGGILVHTCKGNSLPNEAKESLKQVIPGSKVFVDNVTATDTKGKIVKVPGITFHVK